MSKLSRVLIMAGGTGGHVFPGLAVAKRFIELGIKVDWLGTPQGLEASLVPENNIPIHFIQISGFRGKGLKEKLFSIWRTGWALLQTLKVIHRLKPEVVIGMGGFVSGPGGIAAWLLRKKLVIHEQNAKSGTTNKWLAKIAHKTLEAFPHTFKNRQNVSTVGNPVRKEIALLSPPFAVERAMDQPMHLLVLGGSLGAKAINELLPKALAKLPETVRPLVLHQTGEKHLSITAKAYEEARVTANIVPFIKEMDKAYAWADVVLCRAGALTIAELCAAGLGAILVPFPYAIDDHQTANANFMVQGQAALLVQQTELDEAVLAKMLLTLCHSKEKYQAMARAAYVLRKVDATDQVVNVCKEIYH